MMQNRRPQAPSMGQHVQAIRSLNPFGSRSWKIKARVTQKSPKKFYRTKTGNEGFLFSVDLLDEEGGEIRGVAFGNIAETWFDKVEAQKVYYIEKGEIRPANKRFSPKSDYEIQFGPETNIVECREEAAIPAMKWDWKTLGDLTAARVDTVADVRGIIKEIGQPQSFTSRAKGTPLTKLSFHIFDSTAKSIEVTIWNDDIAQFQAQDFQPGDIIGLKNYRLGEFMSNRTLGSAMGSFFIKNPEGASDLQQWYSQHPDIQLTSIAATGGGSGQTMRPTERKSVMQAKSEGLGRGEKPDYFMLTGGITYLKRDNIGYPACPECNRKVSFSEPLQQWSCVNCNKSVTPQYRYIMSFMVSDATGSMWLGAFNEAGQQLLGISAQEMHDMQQSDSDRADAMLSDLTFHPLRIKARAKLDHYQDEDRVRYSIVAVSPIKEFPYTEEIDALIKNIEAYDAL
eukprot:gnl/Trimastix_PCT/2256.p2 GENE.gnl/Trimastix_PCT/2256~~gnl/Trimastix_PCT/2256.p2  ORF type:complete len:454 (-),score=150.47 gnl/Trimastix_PCT/2256:175-1536(-)